MNSMGNYPPISNIPKMHMLEGSYPPPPMPVYYDPSQPYEFAPPPQQNPPSEPYDNRYANWREASESKQPMMMNPPIPPPIGGMHYDMRPQLHHEPYPPAPKAEGFQQPPPLPPQVNVVQRLSGIIKSQLSYLQSIMLYADRKTL